tara:strand:+ start:12244 stop:12525 length:282 start_codon:yes stop_codon:yes gene_type:complete
MFLSSVVKLLVSIALYILIGGLLIKFSYNELIVRRFCVDPQFRKPTIVPISFQTAVLVMVSSVLNICLMSTVVGLATSGLVDMTTAVEAFNGG